MSTLHHRAHRQQVSLHRWIGARTFFRNHPWLLQPRTTPIRVVLVARRELKYARIWIRVLTHELAETRAQLRSRTVGSGLPSWWLAQAACIHRHEAVDWHERRNPASRGGMQIQYATWASVGGRGDPADASPGEQLWRAFLIWRRDGGSWREWTTAGMCGLA